MENFDNIASIGYICTVSLLLRALQQKRGNRHSPGVFDRVAVPAWAVNELIGNDFEDFLDIGNISKDVLFNRSSQEFVHDTRYYTRLSHKTINPMRLQKFKEKIDSRAAKLITMLSSTTKSLLLVRAEEPSRYQDLGDRIVPAEHASKYDQDEKYHLEQLSDTIKTKYPDLDFKILFLNQTIGDFVDNNKNIVGISIPFCDYRSNRIGDTLLGYINNKKTFLEEHL